jgi:hypothetical protein
MKPGICFVMACALSCGGLAAQTRGKMAAKSASESDLSTEERNIRAYIELLRGDLRKSRSQVMGEVMRLDTDDSQKFWPIYKQFETELSGIGDKIVALLKKYTDNYNRLTDQTADQLANEFLSIEQQRNALKKKYYDRMKSSLGAITAARFLQVENQLERLVDLQLSAQLPVASEE